MKMGLPEAGSSSVRPAPQRSSPAFPSKSILIVDDDEAVRQFLAELLRLDGFHILQAGTADQALAYLAQHPVALLMIDVRLPDMDGIALLQRMLEIDGGMLGLVITGHGNIDVAVRAMKAGASDFLAKPFQNELVRHTVTRLMELHRLRQENSVLKHAIIRSGNLRLTRMALTDFGMKEAKSGSDTAADYQRGLAEGERLAFERMATARRQEQELVTTVVDRLEAIGSRLHAAIEQEVASLAFGIAQKVLRDAVAERPELVLAQVEAALAHVPEGGLIKICVHPLDLPLLEPARQALSQRAERALAIKIEADASITRGGCLIHTPSRLVDATLETQLLRIGEALRRRDTDEAH
jgi:FixJ family two-component response regulator/flagellar biosynthesis/type III secretory pathway protein FliH